MIDINKLVQDVEDGNESPLKAYALLKQHSKHVAACIQQIEGYALDESKNHPEKTFKEHGFEFQIKDGSRRWDFSGIQEWQEMKSNMKVKEELYKAANNAYEKGSTMVDDETGEAIPLPKVTYTKSSITVKEI